MRINVLEAYPNLKTEEEVFWAPCGYDPMVSAFAKRVLVNVSDHDYQGDTYVLLADGPKPDEKYGVIIFGWGSCSGCDALQACDSIEDVQYLADSMQDRIKWFPTGKN